MLFAPVYLLDVPMSLFEFEFKRGRKIFAQNRGLGAVNIAHPQLVQDRVVCVEIKCMTDV